MAQAVATPEPNLFGAKTDSNNEKFGPSAADLQREEAAQQAPVIE